ncbi:azurin [Halocola ammonii]
MKNLKLFLFAALSATFILASCGGGSSESDKAKKEETTTQQKPAKTEKAEPKKEEEPKVEVPEGPAIELTIEGNDEMKYNKREMYARAGQEVTLTLKHVGKQDIKAMGHNWVLMKQGADLDKFALAASEAPDNGYIPKSMEGQIIAHTKMLGGGQEDTITFTAPEAGTYWYICSFPGHYMMMRGKFIVVE